MGLHLQSFGSGLHADPLNTIISFGFSTNEWVIRLHLNELPFARMLGTMTTALTLHTSFPVMQLLGLVIYILAGYSLTVAAFRKRELEF